MTTAAMSKVTEPAGLPDMKVSVRQVFGIDTDLEVPAYSEVDPHVPDVDSDYRFDRATTLAILAGKLDVSASNHAIRCGTLSQVGASTTLDPAGSSSPAVRAWATICTGFSMPRRRTKSSDASTAAAAPQVGGQHW